MSIRRNAYLMPSSLAVASMLISPFQAMAQDAGPQGADAYSQSQSEDPPARVGRLATIEGTVSFHAGGETQWSPAVLNAPVSDGDAYWTEPQATAELEVTSSSLWLNGGTEFDLTTLNDTTLHASEPQGEAYYHLRNLAPGETYTIETPRGTVTLGAEGQYDIVAGDTQTPTTVSVISGEAQITGANIALQVHANQTASVTGDNSYQGSVGPLVQDDFLNAMLQREHPPEQARGVAPPPVVAQMTGGYDLQSTGEWSDNAEYGQVWYPPVQADWAPYRDGRWSYVAPWGWTWVDAAQWGFAPFHYGRWFQIGPRWGWAPVYPGYVPAYRPVYAPALVSFFGVGVGIGIGVGIGVGFGLGRGPAYGLGGNVGWVPLGPREAYFPPYRTSRVYINRVNVTNIRNVTNIYNEAEARRGMSVDRFQNGRAATLVPARAMAESRGIAGAYRRPTAAELSGAHPLVDRAPIAPVGRTLGLTPRVAQNLNVRDVQARRAPGPQVAPAQRGSARPELRPSQGSPAARQQPAGPPPSADRPGNAGQAPGPQIGTRENGRPALRPPGASPLERPGAAAGQTPRAERPSATGRGPETARPETAAPTRRPAPRPQASRPEVSRPAPQPRPEPARPAAPRPEPRPQAPRPEPIQRQPQPRPEPRPQPQFRPEPRPQPQARPEPPRPQPRPAPAPQRPDAHQGDKDHPPH